MTVVFVADEGVADSGFNASYQAVSLLDSEYYFLTSDHSFVIFLLVHLSSPYIYIILTFIPYFSFLTAFYSFRGFV